VLADGPHHGAVYAWSGFHDMYSRGDLPLIDGVRVQGQAPVIDASTHHGTGQSGEVGAPMTTQSPGFSSAPPKARTWPGSTLPEGDAETLIEKMPRVRFLDLAIARRTRHRRGAR